MPIQMIKNFAYEMDMPVEEVEKLWDKAKEIAAKKFNKPSYKLDDKEFSYATGVLQNMLSVDEITEVIDDEYSDIDYEVGLFETGLAESFLCSGLSIQDFMEEVSGAATTSSSFASITAKDKITKSPKTSKSKVISIGSEEDDDDDEEEDLQETTISSSIGAYRGKVARSKRGNEYKLKRSGIEDFTKSFEDEDSENIDLDTIVDDEGNEESIKESHSYLKGGVSKTNISASVGNGDKELIVPVKEKSDDELRDEMMDKLYEELTKEVESTVVPRGKTIRGPRLKEEGAIGKVLDGLEGWT